MVARVVDLRGGKKVPIRTRPLPLTEEERPRKRAPLRTRRMRARFAVVGMVLLALAAFVYGAHLASFARVVSIQTVEVRGQEKIESSAIRSYVDSQLESESFRFFSARNIFFYPKDPIEKGIVANFPRVKTAEVSRSSVLSRVLTVAITERLPFALWCASDTDCYALDDGGFIYTASATTTHGEFASSYVFSGDITDDPIGKNFIRAQFPAVLALLRILQQETNLIPSKIAVLQDQDFTVLLEQGFYIKASFGQEPETLARNLDLVLSSDALRERLSDIEYVDLRFGNRVYYKMKGEEQKDL